MVAQKSGTRITLDEAWRRVLKVLGGHSGQIATQMAGARRQYPQFVAAFQLLLGWQGLTARRNAIGWANAVLLGRAGFTPWPPEPPPDGQRLPDDICRFAPTLCGCFNDGDIGACMDLAGDGQGGEAIPGVGDSFRPVRTCDDICADYRDALQCALRFCQQGSLSKVDLLEWTRCQENRARAGKEAGR